MIIEVALNIPLQQTYDYLWSQKSDTPPQLGLRVLVPFGMQKKVGVVVKIKESSNFDKLKSVESILDETPTFDEKLLEFTKWTAHYYFAGWGEVLAAAIPCGLNMKIKHAYQLETSNLDFCQTQRPEILDLFQQKTWTKTDWKKINPTAKEQKLLKSWIDQGLIQQSVQIEENSFKPKLERWVRFTQAPAILPFKNPRKQTKRDKILKLLDEEKEIVSYQIKNHVPAPSSVLKQLKEEGIIEFFEKEVMQKAIKPHHSDQEPFQTLNPEQTQSFAKIQEAIQTQNYHAFLLQGITGSGKTEVYLHATQLILEHGKTCLALVPEIPLTYTFVHRFQARFGSQVAVLHSGMSDRERFDEWYQVKKGRCPIVIGTRSAIFAPLENIGLMIVDEEHDTSYKQGETPRYNARDLAAVRAKSCHATLILGSATPSLESYHNTKQGKYQRLLLPNRVNHAVLPEMVLLNLKQELRQEGCYFFSEKLVDAIRERLKRHEQSLLFLNRRGFSPLLECRDCAWTATCQNCSLALIYHQSNFSIQCHQCHHTQRLPQFCPNCRSSNLKQVGTGTEQIEEKIRMMFPEARLLRMDRDSLRGKGTLEKAIEKIKNLEVDIIVGTQIVTKGHDFPNLTLVGALLADMSLNFPDFRAAERTFQIIAQVAGRAGRAEKKGLALIQTYNPEHHSLQCAKQHDVESFLAQELDFRSALQRPPFVRVALALISSTNDAQAQTLCNQFYQVLTLPQNPNVQISQPIPAPIAKIKNRFRWQLFLTASRPLEIQNLLAQIWSHFLPSLKKQDRISIDMDPYHLL